MLGFYTELFFESIPDEFVDVSNSRWQWSKGENEIPIILSRDYLALYNFGFAPSQGLPQFTPNTIGKLSMDVNISGNGLTQNFQGRIIGFSDRINSILVPQSFMNWANENFGETQKPQSSSLILKTNNPYSPELNDYLEQNKYEVSSGRLIGGQLTTLTSKHYFDCCGNWCDYRFAFRINFYFEFPAYYFAIKRRYSLAAPAGI